MRAGAARVAAIDMGTNSTRLLVADVAVDGAGLGDLVTLDRRMRITRLGQLVDGTRRLQPEAIVRVVAALREFAAAAAEHGVGDLRAVTTSAARDATNAAELLDAAEEVLGVRPEVLEGAHEAELSFLGATAGLDVPGPCLVVDIGGGSTELVVGPAGGGTPDGLVSLDVGCVRLTEQLLGGDPPTAEELSVAVSVVRDHLADVDRLLPGAAGAGTLVGLAGTVSAMAAIEQGLANYDRERIHHFRLTRAAAEDIFRTLATETVVERRTNPGLEPQRADVIVGGVIVAVCVMRHWGFDEMLCSEADILDGVARRLGAARLHAPAPPITAQSRE